MTTFEVHAQRDDEAGVWVAYSDDLPGLVAESGDWGALKAKLSSLSQELIELNAVPVDGEGVRIHILLEDDVAVPASAAA